MTTVPREAQIAPDRIRWLPESAVAGAWADEIEGLARDLSPCSTEQLREWVNRSPFHLANGLRALQAAYCETSRAAA